MANWVITEAELGYPSILQTGTTALAPIGAVINAKDTSTGGQGGCQFVYLKGVTSTVVGSVVSYNTLTGATTLVPNTANLGAPLAVAMTANAQNNSYGWYQVGGAAVVKKTAVKVNPSVKMYISATAGRLMPTAASGKQVLECISINAATVASATSTVTVLIRYPVAQGATA